MHPVPAGRIAGPLVTAQHRQHDDGDLSGGPGPPPGADLLEVAAYQVGEIVQADLLTDRRRGARTLEGLGRRLYDLALADGHEHVARALTYAFGEATCPECEQRFSVVGQVVARAG